MLLGAVSFGSQEEETADRAAASIRAGVPKVKRELAIDLLKGLGSSAHSQALDLLSSEDLIRREAGIRVLSSISDDAKKYVPFLKDPAYTVRKAALEATQNSSNGRLVWKHIHPLLSDPFWPVRSAAIKALAAWPEPGTADCFFEALGDAEPLVRITALHYMDELTENIPAMKLCEAYKNLSSSEKPTFLKACVPLARNGNLSFFREIAEKEKGSTAGTLAMLSISSIERSVPDDWIPLLIEQAMDAGEPLSDAAATLLPLAGGKIVPHIRSAVLGENSALAASPRIQIFLLVSVLKKDAVPVLGAWAADGSFPFEARAACVDELATAKNRERVAALSRVFGNLEAELQQKAVRKLLTVLDGPFANEIMPFITNALDMPDPDIKRKAFAALCRLPEPPAKALLGRFEEEKDPALRKAYALNLVNIARDEYRKIVERLFLDELEKRKPAFLQAAMLLPSLAEEETAARVLGILDRLLQEVGPDHESWNLLVSTLICFNNPAADRVIARTIEGALNANSDLNMELLASNLERINGSHTSGLLHRIFPSAEKSLKLRIFRTLVRRSDPFALQKMEEIFTDTSTSYRRSILEDLAKSDLLVRCEPVFKKILFHEIDPDLLATAINTAPLSMLANQEDRLLELAGLGPELGMDAVEAVLKALSRTGSKKGTEYLREKTLRFIRSAQEPDPGLFEGQEADVVLIAGQTLAKAKDPQGPKLLAKILFLRAEAFREQNILALWNAETEDVIFGQTHTWARRVLDGLLEFDDEKVEEAVFEEIERKRRSGDLYQCGDALFSALCRTLTRDKKHAGRCPALASKLANLTIRCSPDFSPSDFRINLLLADRAEAHGDLESAWMSLSRARHIIRFYQPARRVVREELGDPNPFDGFFPVDALVSEALFCKATAMEADGRREAALKELERARRRSPFMSIVK